MTFLWWLGGLLIGMSILLGILIAASCALRSKRERTQRRSPAAAS